MYESMYFTVKLSSLLSNNSRETGPDLFVLFWSVLGRTDTSLVYSAEDAFGNFEI